MTEYKVKRKVQQQGLPGYKSLTVSIPKIWAEANNIKKGTELELVFNGVLKILPPKQEVKT